MKRSASHGGAELVGRRRARERRLGHPVTPLTPPPNSPVHSILSSTSSRPVFGPLPQEGSERLAELAPVGYCIDVGWTLAEKRDRAWSLSFSAFLFLQFPFSTLR